MPCVLILTLDMESGTYIGDVLRRGGYGVRVADPHSQPADVTGDTADYVVLDVPGASAARLIEASKRCFPQRPVLVVADSPRLSHVLGALEAGADSYMRAPFDPRELAARLRVLVRRRPEPTGERRTARKRCWRSADAHRVRGAAWDRTHPGRRAPATIANDVVGQVLA